MLGALILTGGRSSRMGQDKAVLRWAGVRAVDKVAERARAVGADLILTVGGQDLGLSHVPEPTPAGGPVAGVRLGAQALLAAGRTRALVLAVDAPTVEPRDLWPLLTAGPPGAAYVDLHLPLVLDLAAFPEAAGPGWSMGRLVEAAGLLRLSPPAGALARLRGANTPAERAALLQAHAGSSTAGN